MEQSGNTPGGRSRRVPLGGLSQQFCPFPEQNRQKTEKKAHRKSIVVWALLSWTSCFAVLVFRQTACQVDDLLAITVECQHRNLLQARWCTLYEGNVLDNMILKGVIIHVDYNSATISYITKCCHPAIKKGLYTVLLDSTQWIQQNLPTICTVWVWVLRHVADPSAFAHSSTESVALICDVILTSVRPCPAATTTCHAGYWYRQQFNNTILLRICHALMICI